MADISSSDVTYSVNVRQGLVTDSFKEYVASVAFGDGVLTYPAGGVPLLASKFGFREAVTSLSFDDSANANGYVYKFDQANLKVRIYQTAGTAAHSHALLLKDAAVADGATTRVNAGTNLLGANTGSNITVAGGGANGGVQASSVGTAAVLVELGNVAVVATTLIVVAKGY